MGEVLPFRTDDPDSLLKEAIGKLDRVIIVGATHDGHEYFKWSDVPAIHCFDMDRAKLELLEGE